MMASKARLFGEDKTLSAILTSDDLHEKNSLGRQVRDINPHIMARRM